MTVNAYVVTKLRDVLVAEEVGKKAAMGYFEVEFTLYGCAYYTPADDMVRYKISSNAEEIYIFAEEAQRIDIFPGNVESYTMKCNVPLGEKETIEMHIKYRLAKQLQEHYTKDFFVNLLKLAKQIRTNHAAEILWRLTEDLEGYFSEAQLLQMEELIHYCYCCQKLWSETYQNLLNWLENEYENMADSIVSKDLYEKQLMGIGFEEAGMIKYIQNAQPEYVLRKIEELERNGKIVTPVFRKHYNYNYRFRLPDVVKLFKEEIKNRYTMGYMQELKELRCDGPTQDEIKKLGKQFCETEYCENTLNRYAARWGNYAN